jgi:hypothetical protein
MISKGEPKLSGGQRWLAVGVVTLGLALTPIAFGVMYVTVTDLLRASFGTLAWTVPVGTEVGFLGLFLADLLLEWIHKPLRWLHSAPYVLAAVSLCLNALAARGSLAATLGHAVLPLVFFGYLLAAKAVVRRLVADDDARRHEVALADARAHAHDILRSALGVFWRFRAPVLLRRQLRSGRLPAKVLEAVESGARFGGATIWEPAVETWITAAVVLPERFAGVLAAARAEASQSAPASVSQGAPEDAAGGIGGALAGVPADAPGSAPRSAPQSAPATRAVTPGRASGGASGRHARLVPSKATNEELADLVVPLLAKGAVSKYRVIEVVREAAGGKGKPSIGDERAGAVLSLAHERAGATVLQLDSRKHA